MTALHVVGTTRDGQLVRSARLSWPGGLSAEVWSRGAMLRSLTAPLADGSITQALQAPVDLAAVEEDEAYHDLVVGPVANRIAGARFALDGRILRLAPNEGPNLLHSGSLGWSRAPWTFVEVADRRCVLEHRAPAAGGYPADVLARTTFALTAADTLEIAWEAQVSAPAPVAMTHHLYFNLSAGLEPTIVEHELQVVASAFTPVGPGLIPTGELRPVDATPFDLRRPRRIGEVLAAAADDAQLRLGSGGVDLNWVLDRGATEALALRSVASGLELHLATDQPGLQLYSGQTLKAPFAPFSALAVEPQDFPDAVNQPGFPSVIVPPGRPYRRTARYRFAAGEPGSRAELQP